MMITDRNVQFVSIMNGEKLNFSERITNTDFRKALIMAKSYMCQKMYCVRYQRKQIL